MNVEQEIQRFKMELLRKMPFYGDVLMQLSFVGDKSVEAAATNGKTIWYNPTFFSELDPGERNFILMHEFFHVLLRHGIRNADARRDMNIWNVACDVIINDLLLKLQSHMKEANIPFKRPEMGIFATVSPSETAENLYVIIKADNENNNTGKVKIRAGYNGNSTYQTTTKEADVPCDIKPFELTAEECIAHDQRLQEMIRTAAQKNRGTMGSYFIPSEIFTLTESKRINWKKLLKEFLSQETGGDSSYTTPERKYLHMDMILPGHSLTEETLEEIWAFIDSSGSVGRDEMKQFLTQLYRISREFHCIVNICYWDTSVTDVYKKIRREDDILKCVPHHSGGTDINCVYRWIRENKVKPDVMLILTDGYFGHLTTPDFSSQLGKKTILVLSSDIMINDTMKKIGKIARL